MASRTEEPADHRRELPLDAVVFGALIREEWRMHSTLFGGLRFLMMPVMLGAFGAGTVWALETTGTAPDAIVSGLHVLAAGFGLYAGTAGFAGSDMLENVLGDVSPLLSTTGTLPLSARRLLGLFLVKDAGYYGILFVSPMALAALPLLGLTPSGAASVGALWLSLWLVFAAGMVATVWLIALRTRGLPVAALVAGIVAVAALAWWTDATSTLGPILVPYEGGPAPAATLAATTAVGGAVALRVYDPSYARPERTATDRFAAVSNRLPGGADALVAKTLLELARSSGGVAKPFVSVTILFVLVAALVDIVADITGLQPAPGIFFGGVLGLSAFTTYNWLTQFDAVEDYLVHPVSVEQVFRAKRAAFVVVGAPTVALPYLAAVLYFDATLLDAVAGAVVLGGYSLYYYGLTVFVAGFSPNEFLFDAVRFSIFTVGVAAVLLPALLVGFVVVPLTTTAALVLSGAGVLLGAVGLELTRRAGPRWARQYRTGT